MLWGCQCWFGQVPLWFVKDCFVMKEKDIVDRVLSLLSNIVNQLFFPIEHIAWAADKGLLSVTAAPWWLASLLTWITSLLINIFRYCLSFCTCMHFYG